MNEWNSTFFIISFSNSDTYTYEISNVSIYLTCYFLTSAILFSPIYYLFSNLQRSKQFGWNALYPRLSLFLMFCLSRTITSSIFLNLGHSNLLNLKRDDWLINARCSICKILHLLLSLLNRGKKIVKTFKAGQII